jgi:hypothetical protein
MPQTNTARTPSIGQPKRPPTISRPVSIRRGAMPASGPFLAPQPKLVAPQIRWGVSLFVFGAGLAFGAAVCVLALWCVAQLTSR